MCALREGGREGVSGYVLKNISGREGREGEEVIVRFQRVDECGLLFPGLCSISSLQRRIWLFFLPSFTDCGCGGVHSFIGRFFLSCVDDML